MNRAQSEAVEETPLSTAELKLTEFDKFKNQAGENGFVLPPQTWIKSTNAIGIQSKSGRYGGTYAHSDADI